MKEWKNIKNKLTIILNWEMEKFLCSSILNSIFYTPSVFVSFHWKKFLYKKPGSKGIKKIWIMFSKYIFISNHFLRVNIKRIYFYVKKELYFILISILFFIEEIAAYCIGKLKNIQGNLKSNFYRIKKFL